MFLGSGLVFIFIITWFDFVLGDTCYVASFAEDVSSCPDFKNEWIDAEGLKLGIKESSDDAEGGMSLSGYIDLFKDVNEEIEISITVSKETPHGKDPVITMVADVCENLNDTNTPWYPLMESLNTKECPILAKTYPIEDLVINLDYAKDVLTHEFVNTYECKFELKKDAVETISCYLIGVAISEVEC